MARWIKQLVGSLGAMLTLGDRMTVRLRAERIAAVLRMAALALCLSTMATADDLGPPRAPKPIFTRENVFRVPFFMDPVEPGARRAVEVQLHVSENAGPWKLYAKAPPANGSFLFRATRDGEYRFLVRTKDERGEVHPAGPEIPELIVVLDTDPPVLELLAERGPGGEIRARWRVRDAHLRADSLRLEYQVGPDGPLLPVAIDLPAVGATVSAREATWLPELRAVPVTIRMEVADLAGNIAKRQTEVEGYKRPRDATAARDSQADQTADGGAVWPAERTQRTPLGTGGVPAMPGSFPPHMAGDYRGGAGGRQYPLPPAEEVSPGEMLSQEETLPAPDGKPLVAQPGDRSLPVPLRPEEVPLPATTQSPHQQTPRTRREVEASDGPRLPWLTAGPATTDSPPAVPTSLPASAAQRLAGSEMLPPGVEPQIVNSRRVELGYDLESVGPAGARKVDVWGTRDGGRTWTSFGTDEDQRSPAAVTVDGDGLYGFRLVVESAMGMRDQPPRAGDAPDAWVAVDTVRPAGKLLAVDVGTGAQAGTVGIRWEASDALLAPRPISLFFSAQATGPWMPIGMDLENTGSHVWRPETQVPERVYVRLEIRDRAGNVKAIDTNEPVSLRDLRPRGRIRDVRSVDENASTSVPPVWHDYRR